MKHPDDLTEMWQKMQERREEMEKQRLLEHQELLTQKIRANKERTDDGRLSPTR